MLKIESNDNIAIIPMDDYNKGLKAISDLEMIKIELQNERDDNFKSTYKWIYLTKSYQDWDGEWDEVIMKEEQYKIIKDQIRPEVEAEIKQRLKSDMNYTSKQFKKLEEDRKKLERKIEKSKSIKWYHLLFGWKN